MVFDAYVVGRNGLAFSTYANRRFTLEAVRADERFAPLITGQMHRLLIDPFDDATQEGLYRYVFIVAQEIRDHLTRDVCGLVILNTSEKCLFNQYNEFLLRDRRQWLINSGGHHPFP